MPVRTSPLCEECGFHNIQSTFLRILMVVMLVLIIGAIFIFNFVSITDVSMFLLIVVGLTGLCIMIGLLTIFLLRRNSEKID